MFAGGELEAARSALPPSPRSAVLKIFTLLSDDHPSPVKQIASILGLPVETVAGILTQYIGEWDESSEPGI